MRNPFAPIFLAATLLITAESTRAQAFGPGKQAATPWQAELIPLNFKTGALDAVRLEIPNGGEDAIVLYDETGKPVGKSRLAANGVAAGLFLIPAGGLVYLLNAYPRCNGTTPGTGFTERNCREPNQTAKAVGLGLSTVGVMLLFAGLANL